MGVPVKIQGSVECSTEEVKKIEEIKKDESINNDSRFAAFCVKFTLKNYDKIKRG